MIDNPFLNGNPNATIIVTHNYNPAHLYSDIYDTVPVGVFYTGSHWAIYHQDFSPIQDTTCFNVLICDNIPTGINGYSADNAIRISPNPATDKVIFSNTANKILNVQVFDISGKLLIGKQIISEALDVSMLSTGVYILKINNACYKLMKQ